MTTEDNKTWAITALDMAFEPKLNADDQEEAVAQILRYFEEAAERGISIELARTALHNEFLDTAPVIEPLKRVLQRTLRGLREAV